MNRNPLSVLLVDDEKAFRDRMARALQERGMTVRTAGDGTAALIDVKDAAPEWLVVDLKMPGMGGMELLERMRELAPATRVIVLTGFSNIPTAVRAGRLGAVDYLQKPVDADQLAAVLRGDKGLGPKPSDNALAPSLARVEWEHINRVMAECNDNVSKAARRLGIHRRSLQRKLRKRPPLSE